MTSLDIVAMGLKNLWRRKTRTILTVLGVVIGAASIIIMVSLGYGVEKANQIRAEETARIANLTMIEIRKPYVWTPEGEEKTNDDELFLDDEAVEMFRSMEHVEGVLATKSVQMQLSVGKLQSWSQLQAVDFEALVLFDNKLASGVWPGVNEKEAIVVGAMASMNFYDPTADFNYSMDAPEPLDLMNSKVKCYVDGDYYDNYSKKKRPFNVNVTGVLEGTGSWTDSTSYISFYAYEQYLKLNEKKYGSDDGERGRRRRTTKEDKYDSIQVKIDDVDNVVPLIEQLRETGYEAYGSAEHIGIEKSNNAVLQAILAGIGGVSLLVAAIGITNTMIMSIYERTREIGVMKVLGANLKDIKNMFLFEAAIIGLLGGALGSGLSLGVSYLLNTFPIAGFSMSDIGNGGGIDYKDMMGMMGEQAPAMQELSIIPVNLLLVALVFSTIIGIVSGYYPARKAMKLSALKAISTN